MHAAIEERFLATPACPAGKQARNDGRLGLFVRVGFFTTREPEVILPGESKAR